MFLDMLEKGEVMTKMKSCNLERHLQVKERKRAILEAEKERREQILRKTQERNSRIETKKRERPSISLAFGSSIPRLLEPADFGNLPTNKRMSRSYSAPVFVLCSRPLQGYEQKVDDFKNYITDENGKYNAESAKTAFRSIRTDLTISTRLRDMNYGSVSDLSIAARPPRRAYSISRLDELAKPNRCHGELIHAICERKRREATKTMSAAEVRCNKTNFTKDKSAESLSNVSTSRPESAISTLTTLSSPDCVTKRSTAAVVKRNLRPTSTPKDTKVVPTKTAQTIPKLKPGFRSISIDVKSQNMSTSRSGSISSTSPSVSSFSSLTKRNSVPIIRKSRPASIARTDIASDKKNNVRSQSLTHMPTSRPGSVTPTSTFLSSSSGCVNKGSFVSFIRKPRPASIASKDLATETVSKVPTKIPQIKPIQKPNSVPIIRKSCPASIARTDIASDKKNNVRSQSLTHMPTSRPGSVTPTSTFLSSSSGCVNKGSFVSFIRKPRHASIASKDLAAETVSKPATKVVPTKIPQIKPIQKPNLRSRSTDVKSQNMPTSRSGSVMSTSSSVSFSSVTKRTSVPIIRKSRPASIARTDIASDKKNNVRSQSLTHMPTSRPGSVTPTSTFLSPSSSCVNKGPSFSFIRKPRATSIASKDLASETESKPPMKIVTTKTPITTPIRKPNFRSRSTDVLSQSRTYMSTSKSENSVTTSTNVTSSTSSITKRSKDQIPRSLSIVGRGVASDKIINVMSQSLTQMSTSSPASAVSKSAYVSSSSSCVTSVCFIRKSRPASITKIDLTLKTVSKPLTKVVPTKIPQTAPKQKPNFRSRSTDVMSQSLTYISTSRSGSSTSNTTSSSCMIKRSSAPYTGKPCVANIARTEKVGIKASPLKSAQTTPIKKFNQMSTSLIITSSSRMSGVETNFLSKRESLIPNTSTPKTLFKTSSCDRLNKPVKTTNLISHQIKISNFGKKFNEKDHNGNNKYHNENRNRITSEEEAKTILAEKRRLAREEALRQSELEQKRLEDERCAELKRQEEEMERLLKLEKESIRLAEDRIMAENERLRKAVEEAKLHNDREQLKFAEEIRQRVEREEAKNKAKEETEKKILETAERLKQEEMEREERRKRVQEIMTRTRKIAAANISDQTNSSDSDQTESISLTNSRSSSSSD